MTVVRFILLWTALTTAAHAASQVLFRLPSLRGAYLTSGLLLAFAYAAVPIAQAAALRWSGMRWARDWAVASIAGMLFASAILPLSRSMFIFLAGSAAIVAALQTIVLHRQGVRALWWPLVAAATWGMERGLSWFLTGAWTPGSSTVPLSAMERIAIAAGVALVEAIALAWMLDIAAAPAEREAPPVGRAWVWLEWTTATTIAVMIAVGAAGLVSPAVRRPRDEMFATWLLSPVFAGLAIGTMQWLALRPRGAQLPVTWIAATTAALGVFGIAVLIPFAAPFAVMGLSLATATPAGSAAAGAWVGFCQWVTVRDRGWRTLLWIPAVAFACVTPHILTGGVTRRPETVALLVGAISGLAMIFVLEPGEP